MKNITTFNATNNAEFNSENLVEYIIMKWENLEHNKAHLSLKNPETAKEAFDSLSYIISKKEKFSNYLNIEKENPQVLYKIIYEAIKNNRKIEDQLALFLKQNASKTAQAKIEVWMSLWKYANNPTYIPVNNWNIDLLAA